MPILLLLFVLFITVPLVEISVLGRVMAHFGIATTLALCVLTAFIGALLVRLEGVQTLKRMQATLQAGELPAAEMLEGLALFLAGLMLLTPGFVTDAIGFLILTPLVRRPVAAWLAGQFKTRGRANVYVRTREEQSGGRVIDVEEFREETDDERPPR